jgi:peptide/nickel transport system substrate-binding protein
VDARVRTRARAAWFDRLQNGEFELSMAYSTGGPTPYSFYYRQMSTETVEPLGEPALYNWQRFGNPVADELLQRFSATNDEAEQRRLSSALQREFVEHAPAIPLFMDISKGEYNSTRIRGFPSRDDPYATLAPFSAPSYLLVLTRLEPR